MAHLEILNLLHKPDEKQSPRFKVYRIDRFSAGDNAYVVDRSESWSVVLDATFSLEDEAREYVIKMNRKYCGYELGILYSDNKHGIAQRCTDPEWAHRQRFFLGRPNVEMIAEKLRKDGVHVIRTSKL